MGRNSGARKPPVATVVTEVKTTKLFDDPRAKADFQSTIERLVGKDTVKVVQPNKKLDKPINIQYLDIRLDQLFRDHQLGKTEIPGWLAKLYENLQKDQGQLKPETSLLLKRLTDEIIAYGQQKNIQRPAESLGKVTTAEVVKLLDSLKLIKFSGDPKYPRPHKVQILQEKLDESLGKLKSLLTERPEGWTETYANEVAIVKNIISELEEFLKEVESTLLKEPVFDSKKKATTKFALDIKKNLEHFRQSLKQWDNVAKIIVDKTPKNDDIIIVEHKKNDGPEIPDSKDEL